MENVKLSELFGVKKPIIGMIHLAGNSSKEIDRRALEEMFIFQEEGVDGFIIEDYHGDQGDVLRVLGISQRYFNLVRGINVLSAPYSAFNLADQFGAKFVQFDSVQTPDLNLDFYKSLRQMYPNIAVLGGVRFKYTKPTGNLLEQDLREARNMCEAIVTTGSGTGIETPLNKLKEFRKFLGDFPLIVGAGVNIENVYDQLSITDGAIVGSYFKPNRDTQLPVERSLVRDLMSAVAELRKS